MEIDSADWFAVAKAAVKDAEQLILFEEGNIR